MMGLEVVRVMVRGGGCHLALMNFSINTLIVLCCRKAFISYQDVVFEIDDARTQLSNDEDTTLFFLHA